MIKVLIVFGTRPEAIKMCPLVKEFKKYQDLFHTKVCVTAQHRQMLDQALSFFEVVPDFDLNLMKPDQSLHVLTAAILDSMRPVLDDFQPDYVFVHGDTTSAMAASLASFYSGAKICHIEAGLRTYNKHSPFPEEINRQLIGRLADYHFTPTEKSKQNLIDEKVAEKTIIITGNTVIDALLESIDKVKRNPSDLVEKISERLENKEVILVTGHRRENHGEGFVKICNALKKIAIECTERIIVYPVHLNPNVQATVKLILSGLDNVMLIDPLGYEDFIWMMNRSKLIITDSGGIQEEAPSLGKPVLVLRESTERPEAVEAGTVILVGTDTDLIVKETLDLLSNETRTAQMSSLNNPYGDGNASIRTVLFLMKLEGLEIKSNDKKIGITC